MASNYLDQKIQEINNKYDSLIHDEERRVNELKSQLPATDSIVSYIQIYGVVGFGIWFFIDFSTCLLGALIGAVIGGLVCCSKENSNTDKIRSYENEKEKKVREFNELRNKEIKRVQDEFNSKCSSFARKYVQSNHIDMVVDWLYGYFEMKIKAANRQTHLQEINIPLIYEVKLDCIESEQGKFDFVVRRFKNFNCIEECVGFAEALTKLLYLKLTQNYKTDITGTKVNISVSHNDAHVMIKYIAKNGNFKHVVSF